MKKTRVVQLNNEFIENENLKKRYEMSEAKKKNRFLGGSMILLVILFIFPTYGMVRTFMTLNERKQEIIELQKEYDIAEAETKKQQELAERLKNEEYVAKYARAKYYYSLDGETVYLLPNLLPK